MVGNWEEGFERAKRSALWWVEDQAERMRGEELVVESHLMLEQPDQAHQPDDGAGVAVLGLTFLLGALIPQFALLTGRLGVEAKA